MKIEHLKLYTNKLNEQKEFYSSNLNLKIIDDKRDYFTVQIGDTKLSFIKGDEKYHYHIAINIPSNKINEALAWLKKRVTVQPFNGDDIVSFSNWNANSVYFYDSENNIVEIISRKNLLLNSDSNFDQQSLLSISEIGVPTKNVAEIYNYLNSNHNLEKYDCDIERFCAIGDEEGLFVVIDYSVKKWIPNMDNAVASPFEILFENKKMIQLSYKNEKFIMNL